MVERSRGSTGFLSKANGAEEAAYDYCRASRTTPSRKRLAAETLPAASSSSSSSSQAAKPSRATKPTTAAKKTMTKKKEAQTKTNKVALSTSAKTASAAKKVELSRKEKIASRIVRLTKVGHMAPPRVPTGRKFVAKQTEHKRKNWAKREVWLGLKLKTSGGLTRKQLMCNSKGQIVSKAKSQVGKRSFFDNHIDLWNSVFHKKRAEMGIQGFVKMKQDGTEDERRLWEETAACWEDAVAMRVVNVLQQKPHLMSRISNTLATAGLDSPFYLDPSGLAPAVKFEIEKEEVKTELPDDFGFLQSKARSATDED